MQPPAPPGRSPPGTAFHLNVNFWTKNKIKQSRNVSAAPRPEALQSLFGDTGSPGPLPTLTHSSLVRRESRCLEAVIGAMPPRKAASIPSVRPTRVGALLTHLPTPPLPSPPTSGAARGCIADPAAPTDKSDAAARRHKEEQRPAAPAAPPCWTPSAVSTTPSSTGGCPSRRWSWQSWRGWAWGPSMHPTANCPRQPRSPAVRRRTTCCPSAASTSGEHPSPASAPLSSTSSDALLPAPPSPGVPGFGFVGSVRCQVFGFALF